MTHSSFPIVPSLMLLTLIGTAWSADAQDHDLQPAVTLHAESTEKKEAADMGSAEKHAPGRHAEEKREEKGAEKSEEKNEAKDEQTEVQVTPEMIKRFGITTYHVEPMILREPVIAPGSVTFIPETTMHIGTVVLGRVSAIHVHLGETVKAGDPLITIDSSELGLAQNEWLQKRASIAVAEAEVGITEKAYRRAQVLMKDSGISVGEAQRREGDFLKAQAELVAARAAVQAAENTLRIHGMDQGAIEALGTSGMVSTQLIIRAAAAGTIIASAVTLGEVVRPETESLMTLADTAHLMVVAQVPSGQAGLIAPGSTVRITAATAPGKAIDGRIAYIAPQVDADTRTLSVRIPITSEPGFGAGTFVEVDITPVAPAGDEKEAKIVAVPREAIFTVGGGTVVFVADGDHPGTYSMRKVAAAPPLGSLVPIISGVEDDDEVVNHGGFIIKAEFGKAGAKDED